MQIKFTGRFTKEEFLQACAEKLPQFLSSVDAQYIRGGACLLLHPENEEMNAIIPVVQVEPGTPVEAIYEVPSPNNYIKPRKKKVVQVERNESIAEEPISKRWTNFDPEQFPSLRRFAGTVMIKCVGIVQPEAECSGAFRSGAGRMEDFMKQRLSPQE